MSVKVMLGFVLDLGRRIRPGERAGAGSAIPAGPSRGWRARGVGGATRRMVHWDYTQESSERRGRLQGARPVGVESSWFGCGHSRREGGSTLQCR